MGNSLFFQVNQTLIFDNSEGKHILIAEKNSETEINIYNQEKFNELKNYYDNRKQNRKTRKNLERS